MSSYEDSQKWATETAGMTISRLHDKIKLMENELRKQAEQATLMEQTQERLRNHNQGLQKAISSHIDDLVAHDDIIEQLKDALRNVETKLDITENLLHNVGQ